MDLTTFGQNFGDTFANGRTTNTINSIFSIWYTDNTLLKVIAWLIPFAFLGIILFMLLRLSISGRLGSAKGTSLSSKHN